MPVLDPAALIPVLPALEDVDNQQAIFGALSLGAKVAARTLGRIGQTPIPEDTYRVTDLVKTVVDGIATGTDFKQIYPTLSRLVNQQESRAKLLDQLLLFDDYRRVSAWTEVRNEIEVDLIQAARRGDLRPAERLFLLEMADKKLLGIQRRIEGGASEVNDVLGLLQKANYAVEAQGEALKERFAKTSYQGREIARKLLTRLSRALAESDSKGAT